MPGNRPFLGQRIAVADAAGLHLDPHRPRPRLGDRPLDDFERPLRARDLCDTHRGHDSSEFLSSGRSTLPSHVLITPMRRPVSMTDRRDIGKRLAVGKRGSRRGTRRPSAWGRTPYRWRHRRRCLLMGERAAGLTLASQLGERLGPGSRGSHIGQGRCPGRSGGRRPDSTAGDADKTGVKFLARIDAPIELLHVASPHSEPKPAGTCHLGLVVVALGDADELRLDRAHSDASPLAKRDPPAGRSWPDQLAGGPQVAPYDRIPAKEYNPYECDARRPGDIAIDGDPGVSYSVIELRPYPFPE